MSLSDYFARRGGGKQMSRVKVGVVGLGMGRHHVKWFAQVPQAEVVAVCDANEELLKRQAAERGVDAG